MVLLSPYPSSPCFDRPLGVHDDDPAAPVTWVSREVVAPTVMHRLREVLTQELATSLQEENHEGGVNQAHPGVSREGEGASIMSDRAVCPGGASLPTTPYKRTEPRREAEMPSIAFGRQRLLRTRSGKISILHCGGRGSETAHPGAASLRQGHRGSWAMEEREMCAGSMAWGRMRRKRRACCRVRRHCVS